MPSCPRIGAWSPRRRDSWAGSHITVGMLRQGYDVSLTSYPEGWRATFLHRDHLTNASVGRPNSQLPPTPWRAVQDAAWTALDRLPDR
jgi:hypothetical protein